MHASSPAPGLYLHGSSRLEQLAATLAQALSTQSLPPFHSQTVLIQSPALARWLDQEVTLYNGVSCCIDYKLPANWLWHLYRQLDPEVPVDDPLSRERLPWQIYPLLLSDKLEKFPALKRWLSNKDARERWQLAEKMADLFDRYQYHRPQWLLRWGQIGQDKRHEALNWQAWLWKQLQQKHPVNRVSLLQALPDHLQQSDPESLPQRLDCFNLHNLPAIMVELLHALAEKIPVHIWQFQPSAQYWDDLKRPLPDPDETSDETMEPLFGHPLLMDWGQALRTLDRQFWKSGQPIHESLDDYWPDEPAKTLLQQLQADIRTATQSAEIRTINRDDSLQVHRCHTPMRECETLRDHLLHLLQSRPELQPEDILVMSTDMGSYAPCIQAVFGSGDTPQIPYNLSDVPPLAEQPLIQTFLQWLQLPDLRLSLAEISTQLESPSVHAALGLNAESLEDLLALVREANARWGLHASHRQALGLPAHPWYSWQLALDRLVLGQVLDDDDPLATLVPIPLRTGNRRPDAVGHLYQYLEQLEYWRGQLQASHTPGGWAEVLTTLLQSLTQEQEADAEAWNSIRTWLAELAAMDTDTTVPLGIVQTLANEHFRKRGSSLRQYSGGITFCGLQPLRGVPYPVICLLGMDDQRFPRRHRPASFDGMHLYRLATDPHPGQEDRGLMLETLMACREQLWISYSGRNPQTNETLPAALPLRQLLNTIQQHFRLQDEENIVSAILHDQPLHPFSPERFQAPMPCFDTHALSLCQPSSVMVEPASGQEEKKNTEEILTLSPAALLRFFEHPLRTYLQEQLQIQAPEAAETREEEPFSLSTLQRWQLNQQVLERFYTGEGGDENALLNQGILPPPPLGTDLFEQAVHRAEQTWPALPKYRGRWQETPLWIDLELPTANGPVHIQGSLPALRDDQGLVFLEPGSPHLGRWSRVHLAHLLACASGHASHSLWLYRTTEIAPAFHHLPPLDVILACERLCTGLQWYQQGMQQPLPLLRKAGWAALQGLRDETPPWREIQHAFQGSPFHRGDRQDFWTGQWLRGRHWQPDEVFVEQIRQLSNWLGMEEAASS